MSSLATIILTLPNETVYHPLHSEVRCHRYMALHIQMKTSDFFSFAIFIEIRDIHRRQSESSIINRFKCLHGSSYRRNPFLYQELVREFPPRLFRKSGKAHAWSLEVSWRALVRVQRLELGAPSKRDASPYRCLWVVHRYSCPRPALSSFRLEGRTGVYVQKENQKCHK